MPREYAPGIKRKEYPGNIQKLKPGQLLDYVIQYHQALRAGPHYDFRIGDKRLGMYSWAMRQPLPKEPVDKRFAARTNLHTHEYKDFEGIIGPGYGAGRVTKHDEGKVLITNTTPGTVSFSVSHKKHPERYTLINPKGFRDKDWLVIRSDTPKETGAEKLHYKPIEPEKIKDFLKNIKPGTSVQAKLDGAMNMLKLDNGKAELLSHRISTTTGKPVVQTERFFGHIPHLPDLPKEFKNSVILSEVYGERNGKPIALQDLGALLNASTHKSLTNQRDKGIKLKAMLFDIAQAGGKKVDPNETPYEARKALLQALIPHLPKDKFTLPEEAHTSEDAIKLLEKIRSGQHGQTVEGIVIHPPHGVPYKHKIMPEADVHIRGFFPAEKGSKYDKNAVGGFSYSITPEGPIVGRVGTGLTDETRRMMHSDPDRFKGRIARIRSHGQFESGAHRVGSFIALHEDYPNKKP